MPDRLDSDHSLGMGIWGSPKPILPPPAAARLLVFTSIIDAWLMVFKATVDLRKTEEVRANHNATKFTGVCFLWVFLWFFFLFFWLCWVFVAACGLSLVAASGGYSLLWCVHFSMW